MRKYWNFPISVFEVGFNLIDLLVAKIVRYVVFKELLDVFFEAKHIINLLQIVLDLIPWSFELKFILNVAGVNPIGFIAASDDVVDLWQKSQDDLFC